MPPARELAVPRHSEQHKAAAPWNLHSTAALLAFIYICVRKEDVKIRGVLQPTTQHHSGMVSMENRVLSTTQRAAKGASLL